VRLENPLGRGNFFSGLQLQLQLGVERDARGDGGRRTRFGAVFGRLSVGRPYARKWPFMARGTQDAGMAGAACMGLTT
jgi:hypothetical protein